MIKLSKLTKVKNILFWFMFMGVHAQPVTNSWLNGAITMDTLDSGARLY